MVAADGVPDYTAGHPAGSAPDLAPRYGAERGSSTYGAEHGSPYGPERGSSAYGPERGSAYGSPYGSEYAPGYGPGYAPEYEPDLVPHFRPTHVVPRDGLPAWEAPDPERPTQSLDAFLPVQLTARVGDWGQVLCSNGWSAWVDARLLVAVPGDPPAAGSPTTRTADPRPLIARAEEALGR